MKLWSCQNWSISGAKYHCQQVYAFGNYEENFCQTSYHERRHDRCTSVGLVDVLYLSRGIDKPADLLAYDVVLDLILDGFNVLL